MNTGWSRLEKTAIWNMARRAHDREGWRVYHAFDRVTHLHNAAANIFRFDYDRSLDRAILARSAVVVGEAPVRDSAEWLACRLPRPDPVAIALIRSTEGYEPTVDNRLILLELSDFAFRESRLQNLDLRLQEMEARFPDADGDWRMEQVRNHLAGIADRIDRGLSGGGLPKQDRDAFDLILGGLLAELLRPTLRMAG